MMEDIHDIRPPVMAGLDPDQVIHLLYGFGALAVIGLIVLAAIYLRRSRRPATPVDTIVQIRPYDAAVRSLDRLATTPVHDAKAFYFELGRTVKAYIGGTYGFHCLELTTQELGARIKGIPAIPSGLKSELIRFQDLCDPFRYAPLAPDQHRIQTDLARGRELIDAVEQTVERSTAGDLS